MTRLKTALQMLFSLPGEILDEVILENAEEEQGLMEQLNTAASQRTKHQTAK
jgi:hypothetical protein